jgi:hypothetical protein
VKAVPGAGAGVDVFGLEVQVVGTVVPVQLNVTELL